MMSQMRPRDTSEDSAVVARLAAGDPAALGELYDRHAHAVLRYSWAQLRSQADAQEVLQDTFLTAWDRRTRLRASGGSALPWLLVTARNHARNLIRRNSRRRSIPLDRASDRSSDASPGLDWIADALERLGVVDRRICELCLVEGMSYREAARELGLTTAAVGKRLERARARLRKVALDHES